MYDTVNFWVDGGNIGNPFDVVQYLSDVEERNSEKRGYSCTGHIGDYTATVYNRGISLKGSLAKFQLPSNVYTLTRQTAEEAIERMGDLLHINFGAAIVTRVDVSTVFPTKRPPTDYYSRLGVKPRYKRLQAHPDTLYYLQSERQLIFYDKTKEATAKGAKIPDTLVNCNLMRFEARITKHVCKHCQRDEVTAATLTDGNFYYGIVQMWRDEYKTIRKISNSNIMESTPKTPKEAENALFSMLLQNGGQSCIDEYLNDLRARGAFTESKYYTRLKSHLNKRLQGGGLLAAGDDELIKELDMAVANVANYAR